MTDLVSRLRKEGKRCDAEACFTAADEITRLRAELAKAYGQINRCVDQNRYLESTISRLREYARHQPGCYWWQGPSIVPTPCDCGYDELMKELEESKCKTH